MAAVTVITAAFNCSRTLKCALASLRDQSFADFEALIVGDCCTDDSECIVRGFGDERFHWVNLPNHAGTQSAANNEGLRRARGEYIAYLGQDDLWLPWHLATLVSRRLALLASEVLTRRVSFRHQAGCIGGRLRKNAAHGRTRRIKSEELILFSSGAPTGQAATSPVQMKSAC